MKKSLLIKSTPILITLLSFTSCGYSLKNIYKGNQFLSSEFNENYYDIWDGRLDKTPIKEKKHRVLNENEYFTSWEDKLFKSVEPRVESGEVDFSTSKRCLDMDLEGNENGDKLVMSNQDESFKTGVLSKLYDGQHQCYGYYERARVQVAPKHEGKIHNYDVGEIHKRFNSGFSQMFEKQYEGGSSYFACYFKNAIRVIKDGKNSELDEGGNPKWDRVCHSSIDLTVTFYIKKNDYYSKDSYTMRVKNVMTNNAVPYSFVGFPLDINNIDIKGCNGISIEYKLLDMYKFSSSDYEKFILDDGIDGDFSGFTYGMWLYEVLLPYATWK